MHDGNPQGGILADYRILNKTENLILRDGLEMIGFAGNKLPECWSTGELECRTIHRTGDNGLHFRQSVAMIFGLFAEIEQNPFQYAIGTVFSLLHYSITPLLQ